LLAPPFFLNVPNLPLRELRLDQWCTKFFGCGAFGVLSQWKVIPQVYQPFENDDDSAIFMLFTFDEAVKFAED
jgi:hypothetical protein